MVRFQWDLLYVFHCFSMVFCVNFNPPRTPLELAQLAPSYGWWKESCRSWYGKYPLFTRVFFTSQVVQDFWTINSMARPFLVLPHRNPQSQAFHRRPFFFLFSERNCKAPLPIADVVRISPATDRRCWSRVGCDSVITFIDSNLGNYTPRDSSANIT